MECEHEKRRFTIEAIACPVCEPVRVQTLEALEDICHAETAVEELLERAAGPTPRDDLELQSPPTEARCRCCNRRLTDRESISAGEGPLCREGLCRRKSRAG